jgi:hypothetical protein
MKHNPNAAASGWLFAPLYEIISALAGIDFSFEFIFF